MFKDRAQTAPWAALKDRGISLISVMLLLLVVTILALSMLRKVGNEERIAGSVREHQRAFESAQNALQYAENWLDTGYAGGNVSTCPAGAVDASVTGNILVCDVNLSNPTSLAADALWPTHFAFTPPGMSVSTSGGDGTTYQIPGFYISSLGLAADGRTALYQVLSYGFGGGASAVTVLQSTYALSANVTNLDNP
jgi:type IV pilus assembly protein PilX